MAILTKSSVFCERSYILMIEKAMIMAAGVGSRLDPLTQLVPKPLVPIANIPVMDLLLKHIASLGITEVIANTHYLADQIQDRYKDSDEIKFNYIHEELLSGTAGGLKKCQFFFDEGKDFIVLSADGLTDIDLQEAIASHEKSNCIATMVTKRIDYSEVSKFGVVVTDDNGIIVEFQEKPQANEAKSNLINTGIYIFKYDIFDYIPENQNFDFAKNVFPKLLNDNKQINTFTTKMYWSDIGSIDQYIKSTHDILENKLELDGFEINKSDVGLCIIGDDCEINKTVSMCGKNVIGKNCKILGNAKVVNSILWDNIIIDGDVTIENCVIPSNCRIESSIANKVLQSNTKV